MYIGESIFPGDQSMVLLGFVFETALFEVLHRHEHQTRYLHDYRDLQWLLLRTIVGSNTSASKYHNETSLKDKNYLFSMKKVQLVVLQGGCVLGMGFFWVLGVCFPPSFTSFMFFSLLSTSSFSQEMESAQSRLSEFKLNCHINLLKHSSASFHITMMTASYHSKEPTYSSCSRSLCLNTLRIDGCFSLTFLQFEPTWSSLMELKIWHHMSDPPCFLLATCYWRVN